MLKVCAAHMVELTPHVIEDAGMVSTVKCPCNLCERRERQTNAQFNGDASRYGHASIALAIAQKLR